MEKYPSDLYMKYRMNRLLTRHKVEILFALTAELDDGSKATSLLDRVAKLGPLKAIFFLSMKTLGKEASTLDDVVSPDVHFIGLSSGGLNEFEHRRSKGSPAVLIHSDKPTDVLIACPDFNNVLNEIENNNAEILYKVFDSNATAKTHRIETSSNSSLRDYLPNDAATLNAIGQDDREEFVFFETASLSRRYSQCKGVYPIFALPGIHRVMLEPLFRRLIYPVFSANFASTISLDEAARKLYQSLVKIQPYGPVTLISETWNLPLTLKLTSYLRNVNRKYKIVALEGNPKNWSRSCNSSQFVRAQNGRANYVDEIFNFVDRVKEKITLTEIVSVEKKIRAHAGKISSDSKFVRHVTKAARLIHDKIVAFAERPCTSELGLLENVVLFERHQPVDLEYRLSVTSEIVVINEPEYRGLLSNSEVIRIINENVEFSWWKYSGPENA